MSKKYNTILAAVTLLLLLIGIYGFINAKKFNQNTNKEIPLSYKNITSQEFDKILSTRNPFLVDVHIPEQKHLEGTDLVVPYNKIKENLSKFPEDKDALIIVYCRSGNMSIEAFEALVKAGYTQVKNLVGGINAYTESHYGVYISPITKDLGLVTYGDIAKTSFKLINNTKDKIKITKVTTSCTCTSAVINRKEVDSYGEAELLVSFDPAVHKDDTDLGDIIKTIYIDTSSTNYSKIQASITANVVRKIQ